MGVSGEGGCSPDALLFSVVETSSEGCSEHRRKEVDVGASFECHVVEIHDTATGYVCEACTALSKLTP